MTQHRCRHPERLRQKHRFVCQKNSHTVNLKQIYQLQPLPQLCYPGKTPRSLAHQYLIAINSDQPVVSIRLTALELIVQPMRRNVFNHRYPPF